MLPGLSLCHLVRHDAFPPGSCATAVKNDGKKRGMIGISNHARPGTDFGKLYMTAMSIIVF
jgi:hypothetical protein